MIKRLVGTVIGKRGGEISDNVLDVDMSELGGTSYEVKALRRKLRTGDMSSSQMPERLS